MPKTLTATNIAQIGGFQFSLDATGTVVGLVVTAEVNYGSRGQTERVDIWPLLTAAQKTQAQALYNKVKQLLEEEFLA